MSCAGAPLCGHDGRQRLLVISVRAAETADLSPQQVMWAPEHQAPVSPPATCMVLINGANKAACKQG
jgi:hypothetical protein